MSEDNFFNNVTNMLLSKSQQGSGVQNIKNYAKTLNRRRFHGIYWCAHKTATLTSIQHTVPWAVQTLGDNFAGKPKKKSYQSGKFIKLITTLVLVMNSWQCTPYPFIQVIFVQVMLSKFHPSFSLVPRKSCIFIGISFPMTFKADFFLRKGISKPKILI